jgi:hypothetical protein
LTLVADLIDRVEAIPTHGTDRALPILWDTPNKLNASRIANRALAGSTSQRHCGIRRRWRFP